MKEISGLVALNTWTVITLEEVPVGANGIFFRELLVDLARAVSAPTRIFSDSKSCIDLSYDPVSFKKTKHILRAANGLRDYVARQVYEMVFITGSVNLADILTKAQAVAVFNNLMQAYDESEARAHIYEKQLRDAMADLTASHCQA